MACNTIHSAPSTPAPGPALKGYVRKSETDEILVRDWRNVSPETQIVTLQWPHIHSFYTLPGGATSPLLLTECIRQGLALLSHTVHDIPLDHRLGWEYARTTVARPALRPRSGPTTAELRITHTTVTRRRGGSVHLTAHINSTVGGEHLGTAEIRYTTHPPAIYRRLRREYADAGRAFGNALPPAPPATPGLVGRDDPGDVVIAPTGTAHHWQLRTDTSHSTLYDHPHDHIPGMVLLEAVSQAAQAEFGERGPVVPFDFDTVFSRYVEFDAPVWIDVAPETPDVLGRDRLRVTGTQNGRDVFRTAVTCAPATTPGAAPPRAT
ncbi:ScbA/BarX family gamma-butyrolactone biosynthesis protein [Streptomyces sp. NPDC102264]|uniref:ScbA/BarX family gamma-butyrolactone biosynthesis protein n=1 Tax=Streptomyces sp. NPDC102264 TaxID=3366149 RepID=UPI0038131E8B